MRHLTSVHLRRRLESVTRVCGRRSSGASSTSPKRLAERGYPIEDFDRRAADVSVDHPGVVENYRAAHAISERNSTGDATTEDLRQAMVHYRALFDELLGNGHRDATESQASGKVRS